MHRNCLFIIAANGSEQKDSMHASYTRSEYLCLPELVALARKERRKISSLTFQLESEVVSQMSALVIPS